MNKHHRYLLSELKQHSHSKPDNFNLANYLGSKSTHYYVRTADKRRIAKFWVKENKDISRKDFVELLDSLFAAKSFEEKTVASELLHEYEDYRIKISFSKINKWLGQLHGWAEIDSFCYGTFSASEMLDKWRNWKAFLKTLSKDKDIGKRRVSLVLLTKPVRENGDKRLSKSAFNNIDTLKHEDEILITKAVSWLLRSLITHHRGAVSTYIKTHEEYLPKIVVRETKRKLETGKK